MNIDRVVSPLQQHIPIVDQIESVHRSFQTERTLKASILARMIAARCLPCHTYFRGDAP